MLTGVVSNLNSTDSSSTFDDDEETETNSFPLSAYWYVMVVTIAECVAAFVVMILFWNEHCGDSGSFTHTALRVSIVLETCFLVVRIFLTSLVSPTSSKTFVVTKT